MLGFIKKVLIADSLAPMNTLFIGGGGELQMADAWFGLLISALQLYFDFSGYSDMAIGLGMMMGFRFAENFNQPWIAQSITEFWQRWHMTLADFLRDYVYMPLVRKRLVGMLTGLVITMLLSGLWHGPSFAFIFWGLFFGIAMVIERKLGIATKVSTPYNFWRNARTCLLTLSSMPLFFTGNLPHSLEVYKAMIGLNGFGSLDMYWFGTSAMTLSFALVALLWIAIAGGINIRYYAGINKDQYFMHSVSGFSAVLLWAGFILTLSRLAANSFSPFLYFQF
jgi:alginate O-acetyltransferase complex protein AlgI